MRSIILNIIKTILAYCIVILICGVIKTNFLLQHVNPNIRGIVEVANYITLFIGFAFAFITMIIIASSAFASLFLFEQNLTSSNFVKAYFIFISILTIIELIKTITFSDFFPVDFYIDNADFLLQYCNRSGWNDFSNKLDIMAIMFGGICYFLLFAVMEKWKNLLNITLSSLSVIIAMTFFRIDYLISIF